MSLAAPSGAGPFSIYTGRATNWSLALGSAALLLPLLLLGKPPGGGWADLALPGVVAAAGVALGALTGSSIRTTAGPNGVTVHFGALGWPRCSYPLGRIARAEVIHLSPWYVAGFWWTPRRTCCTLRSGPTLRLLLDDGRSVTITVPDPQAAVAAVEEARASRA